MMLVRNVSGSAVVVLAALLAGVPDLAVARAPAEKSRDGSTLVQGAAPARGWAAAPAVPAAPARSAVEERPEIGVIRFGATAGLDLASDFTGVGIQPQISLAVATLAPRLHLDVTGHLGIAMGGATGYTALYLAAIPGARLRYDLSSRFALYGDMGLGLFLLRTSLDNDLDSDIEAGAVLRLPFGVRYAVNPSLDVVFEPIGVTMYFNTNGNKFHYSLLAGFLLKI